MLSTSQTKAEAPREVREKIEWLEVGVPKTIAAHYFAKAEWSQAAAWEAVPYKRFARNPYRAGHTLNFWIWWRHL